VTVEGRLPEIEFLPDSLCSAGDEVVFCAKAEDVRCSEIGRRPLANDRQTPETANAKRLRCCVVSDLIGRMVDILRVARPAIRRHQTFDLNLANDNDAVTVIAGTHLWTVCVSTVSTFLP
jgi:hypothetical protein